MFRFYHWSILRCRPCRRYSLCEVLYAKSARDISTPTKGDLEATAFNSDLIPIKTPWSAVAFLSLSSQASSAVAKRAKKSAATGKPPRSLKNLALDDGSIKLTPLSRPAWLGQYLLLKIGLFCLVYLKNHVVSVALRLFRFARETRTRTVLWTCSPIATIPLVRLLSDMYRLLLVFVL